MWEYNISPSSAWKTPANHQNMAEEKTITFLERFLPIVKCQEVGNNQLNICRHLLSISRESHSPKWLRSFRLIRIWVKETPKKISIQPSKYFQCRGKIKVFPIHEHIPHQQFIKDYGITGSFVRLRLLIGSRLKWKRKKYHTLIRAQSDCLLHQLTSIWIVIHAPVIAKQVD